MANLVAVTTTISSVSKVLVKVLSKTFWISGRGLKKVYHASGVDNSLAPIIKPIDANLGELYQYASLFSKILLGKVVPAKGYEQVGELEKEKTPVEFVLGAAIMTLLTGGTAIYLPIHYTIKFFLPPKVQAVY